MLEDMRDAAAFVLQATCDKQLEDFRAERLLRQAIERNFEIIGEAVGRLAKCDPATVSKINGYQKIVAFRNLLSHGYDIVDEAQVWEIITFHLPLLLSDITALQRDES